MLQENVRSGRGGDTAVRALREVRGHGEEGRLGQRLLEPAELESNWSAPRTENGRPDIWLAPVSGYARDNPGLVRVR